MQYPRLFRKGRTRKLRPGEVSEIRRLRRDGATGPELAKTYGVTATAIYYWTSASYREYARAAANARLKLPGVNEASRARVTAFIMRRYRNEREYRLYVLENVRKWRERKKRAA